MSQVEQPPSHKKLSVIIPVYDERTTVAEIIRRVVPVAAPGGAGGEGGLPRALGAVPAR